MRAKSIKENIQDVLKPKNLIDKYFYYKSYATGLVEYIFRIKQVFPYFILEVIYNNHMVEGDYEFEYEEGTSF